ncbi:MAG: bacillithiol biosynthesis deacetylase BshB1 [Gemmatimonadaceae bacterium]
MSEVDVLAIAAHRDDIELTCGGTMIVSARQGHRTGVIDLTAGELGTRGSAEIREREAANAAKILGLSVRENLGLPDAAIVNTPETRAQLVPVIRRLRPTIVIAPAQDGRHPDHRVTSELVRDACFLAGLAKFAPGLPPHRPRKVLHCITYREEALKPTFVVDISDVFEEKLAAMSAHNSQLAGVLQAGEVYPNTEELFKVVRHQAAHYGSLIRCKYGEPFYTAETMRVADILPLEVSTF